jgi:hypothetical protein
MKNLTKKRKIAILNLIKNRIISENQKSIYFGGICLVLVDLLYGTGKYQKLYRPMRKWLSSILPFINSSSGYCWEEDEVEPRVKFIDEQIEILSK